MPNDISLITIGSELLRGRIVNTNATEVAQLLRRYGYTLRRTLSLPDTEEDIRDAVEREMRRSRVVLLSGGLGPTRDDLTKHTLAALAGVPLRWHEPTRQQLVARYAARGQALNPLTEQQALVPAGWEVIPNAVGTAPGLAWDAEGCWTVALPGVPFELLHILEHEVIPRLQPRLTTEVYAQEVVRLHGITESEAATHIAPLLPQLPADAEVSYLPRHDGLWIELGVHRPAGAAMPAASVAAGAAEAVAAHFAAYCYARSDAPVGALLQAACRHRGLTLAVAESLTGGEVAAAITQNPGASHFFRGSVTAYATAVKETVLGVSPDLIATHGVASAATAEAMAQGVRRLLGASIGLATTGLAEPNETSPAHAWIAYASPQQTYSTRIDLRYQRTVNMTRAAQQVLILALKKVTGQG